MVEQPDHHTTRPILTPSIRILSRSSRVSMATGGECLGTVTWGIRRAEGRLGHHGTLRVQRRLMHDEVSGGLPTIGSTTHDTEERVMGGLGMQELLIILVIALLFF